MLQSAGNSLGELWKLATEPSAPSCLWDGINTYQESKLSWRGLRQGQKATEKKGLCRFCTAEGFQQLSARANLNQPHRRESLGRKCWAQPVAELHSAVTRVAAM